MRPVTRGAAYGWKPQDQRTPWKWCEDNVEVDNTSFLPGHWRSDNSPWVREIMDVFGDNRVNEITVQCAAQSSKTQTMLNLLCWAVAEDPGPAMWVMAAKDEAETFVRDRAGPAIRNCKAVARQLTRESKLEFTFTTMPLYFTGAGSPSKIRSKPIRWLLLDEVRNYKPGALETVRKRTRTYWNSRTVIISTPDKEKDAMDRAYLDGDQRVFHVTCPKCRQLQPLKLEQLKWETSERTKPEGRWNFDVLAETIRYVCVACGHEIRDTPTERKRLCAEGKFVRQNLKAPRWRVSFHWNAMLPWWVPWRSVVEEFIAAREAARHGDLEPLKTFHNETLGEPWRDELGEIEDYDFLEQRKGDYDYGDDWAEERTRFMGADRQAAGGEHYWWVIRSFGPFGKSRLVAYGRCNTTAELEEIRRDYGVSPLNAVIDSGHKASEVYKFCLAAGWKPFKGDDAQHFVTKDGRTGRTYRQVWQRTLIDPAIGTPLAGRVRKLGLFRWSNDSVKDLLATYMAGLVGEWTIPKGVGRDYLQQITAERRVELFDTRGRSRMVWKQTRRDNHLRDCELQILVAAIVTKNIAAPEVSPAPPK